MPLAALASTAVVSAALVRQATQRRAQLAGQVVSHVVEREEECCQRHILRVISAKHRAADDGSEWVLAGHCEAGKLLFMSYSTN